MNENIDWEDMMKKTERSASSATLKAERAVGALAQVLETQRQHSQQLAALKKIMEAIESLQKNLLSQLPPPANNAQGEPEISFRFLALGVAAVLVVGMGLGAYFAS
jgi:hypothetical protein